MNEHENPAIEFRYYMLRVQTPVDAIPGDGAPDLSGVVERLGSGEKRAFSGADELVRLVTAWSDAIPNMGLVSGPGNG